MEGVGEERSSVTFTCLDCQALVRVIMDNSHLTTPTAAKTEALRLHYEQETGKDGRNTARLVSAPMFRRG